MTFPQPPADPNRDQYRPVFANPEPPAHPQAPSMPASHGSPSSMATDRPATRRSGRGIGTVLAAAALSATLAAGGTALAVTELVPARTVVTTDTGVARTTSSTTVQNIDLTAVVAEAQKSVVTITANGLSADGFSPFGQPTSGIGSGIVLTQDGYILT